MLVFLKNYDLVILFPSVAHLITFGTRTFFFAEKEVPYTAYNYNPYNYGYYYNSQLLPIGYHMSSSVIWYAIQAKSQAIAVLYSAEPTAHFQLSSEPIAIIVAIHGR